MRSTAIGMRETLSLALSLYKVALFANARLTVEQNSGLIEKTANFTVPPIFLIILILSFVP